MQYVEQAYTDAYRRFIRPAIERELRKELTARVTLVRSQSLVIIFTTY